MGLTPKGRNWGLVVNWDSLGKAYAAIITIWTALLLGGIVWLIINRRLHYVKMRNLPVAIGSVVFLWVYLFKIFMAYTTNGHFKCSAEYWIMSVYLPLGIALFQANVTQLRSVSVKQTRLLSRQSSSSTGDDIQMQKGLGRYSWYRLSEAQKGYIYIAIALLLQLIITAAMYSTSPVLQGDWSSFGKISFAKGQAKCRKSVEWIPSAFWQLFWSWVYGPYLLFTVRNIRDMHHWRLQIILSVLAGLPGTPLWIAAVFTNGTFKPVNIRWVPPMWLAPGIMVMQGVTIFFPIWEYFEHKAAMRRSPYLLDTKDSEPASTEPSSSERTLVPSTTSRLFDELKATGASSEKDLYRMSALEKALAINPAPLLVFAATKDFTAENIIFLIHLRDWHQAWRNAPRKPGTTELTPAAKVELFKAAVDIHFTSVSEKTAEFPINIEGPLRNDLDAIFSSYQDMYDNHNVAPAKLGYSPIDMAGNRFGSMGDGTDVEHMAQNGVRAWLDEKGIDATVASLSSSMPPTPTTNEEAEKQLKVSVLAETLQLPALDEHIFDLAERSVKYLVLTNTWRKFVTSQKDQFDMLF